MAYVRDDYPLYFDAVNEKGLCMAGLNFVGNAFYRLTAIDMNKQNLDGDKLFRYPVRCSEDILFENQ